MAYKQVRLGDYLKFEKGLGYKGEFLAEESDIALIGMDSHNDGGGYKEGSEKPYIGPFKPEHVAEVGDVIFAATEQGFGLLASPLMVPESDKYQTYIYSHHVLKAFPIKEGFLPEYLYNIFRIERYRSRAAYGDTGTTVRALPAEVLEDQMVPLPNLSIQQAINEIIAMFDQQIANNKALSKSLEILAQAMFKSWFIDFDPVHAKSKSEKPFGMDEATAALFPSSFEDSELGEIPRGWHISSVEGILQRIKTKSLSASTEMTRCGKTPVLEQGDSILAGFVENSPNVFATPEEPRFIFGDHTCRMKLLTRSFSTLPNTIVLQGKDRNSYWAFCVTNKLQPFESYRRHWMELIVRKIIVPPTEVADVFGNMVAPLFEKMDQVMFENFELERVISSILQGFIDGSLPVKLEKITA